MSPPSVFIKGIHQRARAHMKHTVHLKTSDSNHLVSTSILKKHSKDEAKMFYCVFQSGVTC